MITTNKQKDPSYGHRLANAKKARGNMKNIPEHYSPNKNKNTPMGRTNQINHDIRNTN